MGAASPGVKYSDEAVSIRLSPSRMGAAMMVAAASATLGVIAATPIHDGVRILAATWVACGMLEALHSRARLRGRRGVRALHVRGESIEVENALGERIPGRVRAGSFVAPWLTIVRWRPEGARFDRTVPILPGMLPAEDFRRLRVLLRWA